jgi:hypothetical protein
MRNGLFLCVGDNLRLCLLLILICSSQISAYGTLTIRYHTTVTNILGANKIAIDDRRSQSGFVLHGNTVVPLDGLASVEEDSQHEIDIRGVLEDKLLGKKVNIIEFLDMGQSRGGSVYVTDDPRRYAKEDNINLRLVRDGVAKWSGACNVSDISPGEMEEAQRLAQAERKGIWKHLNASPTDSEPPPTPVAITSPVTATLKNLTAPVTPVHTNAPPVAENPSADSLPSCPLCPAVLLGVGAGIFAALLLWRGLRKRKQ